MLSSWRDRVFLEVLPLVGVEVAEAPLIDMALEMHLLQDRIYNSQRREKPVLAHERHGALVPVARVVVPTYVATVGGVGAGKLRWTPKSHFCVQSQPK